MSEEKSEKLEKVGNFVSSTFNKIINLIIFLIITGLLLIIAWFWHESQMDKQEIKSLKKENIELREELKGGGNKDLEVKKVDDSKNVGDAENENDEMIEIGTQENFKGDYYCETDSDCVVKNVASCDCYPSGVKKPRCVNKDSSLDQIVIKCGPGDSDKCNKNITLISCGCMNNSCKGVYKD